jgi:large repetitive protein
LWSATLPISSPDLAVYPNNYAVELRSGESLVHNSFVLPDWGSLRFNVFAPNLNGGNLNVLIEESGTGNWIPLHPITIQRSEDPLIVDPVSGNLIPNPARPNNVGYYDFNNGLYEDPYTHTISYGERGFETFVLDVPNYLRGKSVKLKFTSNSNSTIYLDDVFFKSQHLLLGNPSDARPDEVNSRNNYLIEKPQYSLSYNDSTKTANWVSYYHNATWLGDITRSDTNRPPATTVPYVQRFPIGFDDNFPNYPNGQITPLDGTYSPRSDRDNSLEKGNYPWVSDQSLPSNWVKTQGPDYSINNRIPESRIDRGHLVASSERSRTTKDNLSTFLTTNLLPQISETNQIGGAWRNLEVAIDNAVKNRSNPTGFYIMAGGANYNLNRVDPTQYTSNHPFYQHPNPVPGVIRNLVQKEIDPNTGGLVFRKDAEGRIITGYTNPSTSEWIINPKKIGIPDFTWKLIVNLSPGQGIADITSATSITAVLIPNVSPALLYNNQFTLPIPNGRTLTINNPGDWTQYIISVNELEEITGYDFLSEVHANIGNLLKQVRNNTGILSAPLLADNPNNCLNSLSLPVSDDSSIRESQLPISSPNTLPIEPYCSNEINILHVEVPLGSFHVGTSQISGYDTNLTQVGISQTDPFHVAVLDRSFKHNDSIQVSSSKIRIQDSFDKGVLKISSDQNGVIDNDVFRFAQVSFTQVSPTQVNRVQHPTEIPLTSSIALQQFLSSHNFGLQNKTVPLWTEFLQSPTPFNLKVEITDLPTGQLAEGTITGYDTTGRPNAGTLTLDINGNNQGWFIDTTPGDNSEFDKQLTETAYQATNSPATGKYDLLTVILHELGHIQGIIKGNSAFDANVKNNTFIGKGFTATLTADGSHLDNTLYPYDLLNTSLKPGIRKLPSQLDLAIINQLHSNSTGQSTTQQNPNAALTAGALFAIENGDFTSTAGWNLQGGTTISNGAATLTETSQKLAQLTQDLIIPTGAKRLQFTIKDNHLVLGDSSKTANDAFEVALLGTNYKPLAGTSQGLNNTDSLLNIQANGTTYKSNKVTITSLSPTSQIVSIDLTEITPETQATLYFNLLGFGARTSTVKIDDIKLFSAAQPIANPDNIVTNQSTPIAINPTINDSNIVGIQIIDLPTHGTLSQNPTGQIIYQPTGTYIGTDRFTYIGFNSEGSISNQATVDIVVNNLPPSIETINIPTTITEGQTIQLSAAATDKGSSDILTYKWNLGDGSDPISGQQITHTFTDNGIYNAILTVTDQNGGITEKAIELKVDNVAPSIIKVNKPTTITEGQSVEFSAIATDAGLIDTLTYSWNFGDGTAPLTGQQVSHTFVDNGIYSAILSVIDKDGGVTEEAIEIKVDNAKPSIVTIEKPTQINEGQTVEFKATATDAGANDTLTYTWNFGDNTNPVNGQNTNHTYADNGNYNVVLTVTDKDGAITTETTTVKVDNVLPLIVKVNKPIQINEGQSVEFSANATDAGSINTLAYSWNFGDGTDPVTGQTTNHTFADNGIYNAILTVTDKDGGVSQQSIDIKVDNEAPVVVSVIKPAQISEGQAVEFKATATDAGVNDTLTYTWNFGDNTNPISGQTVSHTFIDNGNYNVVLTVTDKDGAATTKTEAVKVDNVLPLIVNVSKPTQINEGQSVQFSATSTDAGVNDTLTYSWNFADGSAPITGQTINHTFVDDGIYNAILTVTDKDGGATQQAIDIKVDNVAPVVVSVIKPAQISEGQAIEFRAIATDAGVNDTLTYTWNFGDNTNPISGQNVTHTFIDNGNYNVVLTVTDKDGATTTKTEVVKVDNVLPSIINVTKPAKINEGQSVQFSATATDPGSIDTLTYKWNFGDGTATVTGQTINHTFVDNGIYNTVLTVTDKDGGATQQAIEIKVDNVAPTIASIIKPAQVNEGQAVEFKATATDAGVNDTLTYTWNFGDNTKTVIGQNTTHTFVNNGNYNVVLTITDKDGGSTTQTTTVKVDNVLPSIVSITKPNKIDENQTVEFSAKAQAGGTTDVLSYSWNFGDGSEAVIGEQVSHTFADNGIYQAVLTVTDKDGGVTKEAIEIKVDNVAPAIISITKPNQINEGQQIEFKAIAKAGGANDILTYVWNFGDNNSPVNGQNATHTFADNGNYNVVLTVTDKDGATTTQTNVVQVDNVSPSIVKINKPSKIDEGQSVDFSIEASDPGTDDNLTYSWKFGESTEQISGQKVKYVFTDNGNRKAILIVKDKDGGIIEESIDLSIDNVLPAVIKINKPTTINEGQNVQFSATATDVGANDTLTYNWNFGDGTATAIGQSINHTFADNGVYNAVLTVTDKDGGVTKESIEIKVDNVLPSIVNISKPNKIEQGQPVEFTATAKAGGTNDNLVYTWDFGDGSQPVIGQKVSHTFTGQTILNPTLTVTDKDGGTIREALSIQIEPKIAPVATKPGVFTVGENGQISIDYLFDGGYYQAQMSIFSLAACRRNTLKSH